MATRSRKGYWRMSSNSIVQRALTNRWLHEQGVPDMRTSWTRLQRYAQHCPACSAMRSIAGRGRRLFFTTG